MISSKDDEGVSFVFTALITTNLRVKIICEHIEEISSVNNEDLSATLKVEPSHRKAALHD